jgi:hypothetical protein
VQRAGFDLFLSSRLLIFERLIESFGIQLIIAFHGRLVREASIHAKQSGERNISPRSVRKVREVCFECTPADLISRANNGNLEMFEEIQGLRLLRFIHLFEMSVLFNGLDDLTLGTALKLFVLFTTRGGHLRSYEV